MLIIILQPSDNKLAQQQQTSYLDLSIIPTIIIAVLFLLLQMADTLGYPTHASYITEVDMLL